MALDLMLHPLSAKVFFGESVEAGILAQPVLSSQFPVFRLLSDHCSLITDD
jgi:hypothetical protein